MEKRYRVQLSKSERKHLQKFVKTGIAKAREILRARILLQADEGQHRKTKKDAEIAEELDVCLRTVAATRERFFEGGVERALHDLPRSGLVDRPLNFQHYHNAFSAFPELLPL